jgi:hypothetical protein
MDSEKIVVSQKYHPSDFGEILKHLIHELPVKMAFIVFMLYIILSSDVFINRVLGRIHGAISGIDTPSTYGTVVTGLLLTLFYIIFDVLVRKEVV